MEGKLSKRHMRQAVIAANRPMELGRCVACIPDRLLFFDLGIADVVVAMAGTVVVKLLVVVAAVFKAFI